MTLNDPVFKASNDFDIDDMPAIGGDPAEPVRLPAYPHARHRPINGVVSTVSSNVTSVRTRSTEKGGNPWLTAQNRASARPTTSV